MDYKISESPYYLYNNRVLSLFGQWPYQNLKQKFFYQLSTFIIVSSLLVPMICKIIEERSKIQYLLLAMPSLLFYMEFLTKYLYFSLKHPEMRTILDNIKDDFQIKHQKSLRILHDYSKHARKLNIFYIVYLSSSSITYNISAWTPQVLDFFKPMNESRPKAIPRFVKYYVDSLDNNFNFIILHGIIVDYYVVLFYLGFDTLVINCCQHACALFKIVTYKIEDSAKEDLESFNNANDYLKKDIENIKKMKNYSQESQDVSNILENCAKMKQLYQDKFYQKIVEAIRIHKRSLEFVELIDSMYKMINLCCIGISLLAITLTELETVLHIKDTGLMMRYTGFTVGLIVHILYFNWPGQNIKDHSLLIYQSCYNFEWYRDDITNKTANLLKLMMAKSQRSSNLTAGKIYSLGYENFATMLKVSASFFTVLLSLQ